MQCVHREALMFLGDFHVHSTFSDGKLTIPQVVDLYGKHGFGAIAITDHLCEEQTVIGKATAYIGCTLTPATFPIYMEIIRSEAKRAWDLYKMVVIPGYELSKNSISNHRSAHIVALNVTDYIPADADPFDLAKKVKAQGALAIAAHPVWTRKLEAQTYYLWDRRDEFKNAFDAWEVASGPFIFDEVARTKLPKIAVSDLHIPRHINAWKTLFTCERHPEAILEAIKKQQIDFRFFNAQQTLVREIQHVASQPMLPPHVGLWARKRDSRNVANTRSIR